MKVTIEDIKNLAQAYLDINEGVLEPEDEAQVQAIKTIAEESIQKGYHFSMPMDPEDEMTNEAGYSLNTMLKISGGRSYASKKEVRTL